MRLLHPYTPVPLGMKLLRKVARVNPLIVNYHVVSPLDLPYVKHLYAYRDPGGFEEDLDYFRKHFCPLAMPDFLEMKTSQSGYLFSVRSFAPLKCSVFLPCLQMREVCSNNPSR